MLNKFINDLNSDKNSTRNYINSRSGNMSQEEALKILGLNPESSQTEINSTYHNLMKSIHPDKGGSSYLAQKLNEARDRLLKK
ncbi:MAG: DnaJ domain-containing protein [Wolbachia sp.]|nr:DnaJ domain-containing protein [Wolbachia sp.]MDD9336649.1 DnaJ domain-containing protein [Wolbachia sp.]